MEKHDAPNAEKPGNALKDPRCVEEQCRFLQNYARTGLWELWVDTDRLSWSDLARHIVREGEDGSLEEFLSRVHQDDRQGVQSMFEKAGKGQMCLDTELRLVQQAGAIRHLRLQAQLMDNETGRLLFGTVEDISERKDYQKKLQEKGLLLEIAGRLVRIGGWIVELPDRHLEWSDEVAVIHDLPPGSSPTLEKAINFIAPEWREKITNSFEECIRTGTPYDMEAQIITATGRCVWVRIIGQAVVDDGGAIRRVQGAFQDISMQKQSEFELHRLATQLTDTLESITDAFFTLDHNWRFTYVNKEAERLLMRRRSELLGKIFWNEFPDLVGAQFDEISRRAIRERRPVTYEAFFRRLSIWVEVHMYPTQDGLAVYFNDVTHRKRADATLRLSEERFKLIAKVTSDAVWDWDLKTNTIWWSEGIRHLFGYSPHEIENTHTWWVSRIHPEDRAWVQRGLTEAMDGAAKEWRAEYRFKRNDNSYAYVEDRAFFIRNEDGAVVRAVGAMVDVTERRRADIERHRSETRLRDQAALLDNAKDAMMVAGLDTRITFWNKGAERLFGWTAAEALGKTKAELIIHDLQAFKEAHNTVLERGEWSGEIRKRRKDGSTLTVESHWTLVLDDEGKPHRIFAIDSDITQRKEAEREIENLAFFDPLTRLPNRRLLLDRLQHALATSSRSRHKGALLYIDLDNFKSLNDTLGHDKGDLLLKQVAQRLETCARKSNTVARLGGDEFVVMLEDLSDNAEEAAAQAEIVGEKILAMFNQPFQLDGYQHHSTPSIGVALFNQETKDVDELLKRADLAMYQAKAAGRNTIRFFDPNMQTVVSTRVALEIDMRHGINDQEFFLNYQSQADINGRTIGVEALVRWQHPHRGLISPALFIPLAEETGLILRLGQWILEAACNQLKAWEQRPNTAHLSVAVNVSARQFRTPDFVGQVQAVLDRTGANPHNLKFELTESLLLANVETTIATMAALKEKGVSFALDDFGTGYSSLSYLKRLPLDQLKIDQSFVRDVLTDANDAAIARTIVALGQTLGLEVIAEGVETIDQRDFLARHGCHVFQGFLYSPALPADRF